MLGERRLGLVEARQVVLGVPDDGDVVAALGKPLDEVRAEKARAARDEHAAHRASAPSRVCQSTRPSQCSRFDAYHSIVRRTPSSHETLGSQPVSRLSFS